MSNGSTAEYRPILGPDGRPITIGRIVPIAAGLAERPRWEHDPEKPTHESFARYCEWRKTKCRLRDLRHAEQYLEELDEATHQFVGEVGELGELILTKGVECLTTGEGREKMLDEIGDVFFCGLWLLDAYGFNPFRLDPSITPDEIQGDLELQEAYAINRRLCETVGNGDPLPEDEGNAFLLAMSSVSWQTLILSALACNSFKKMRWQRRTQDRQALAQRTTCVLCQCAHLLAMAGYEVSDALKRNVEKLDARFPEGYVGPGGGIREGKGA